MCLRRHGPRYARQVAHGENFRFRAHGATRGTRPERRGKFRIQRPFPASVTGVDCNGGSFAVETELDNLSSGGLYVRLNRRVPMAAELSFVVRFPSAPDADGTGMHIAACGIVRRVDPGPGGTCGLGVEFTRYHIL